MERILGKNVRQWLSNCAQFSDSSSWTSPLLTISLIYLFSSTCTPIHITYITLLFLPLFCLLHSAPDFSKMAKLLKSLSTLMEENSRGGYCWFFCTIWSTEHKTLFYSNFIPIHFTYITLSSLVNHPLLLPQSTPCSIPSRKKQLLVPYSTLAWRGLRLWLLLIFFPVQVRYRA